MTYFSIFSSSFCLAMNWESFLISLMAPFTAFLYLCIVLCFSANSRDPPCFFWPSKLKEKNKEMVFYVWRVAKARVAIHASLKGRKK